MAADLPLPLVLFLADIAGLLRCDERTVSRLKRSGQLPDPLPLPGRPRWSRDAVLSWLNAGEQRPRLARRRA
jgi:hypothetical protein